MRRGFSAASQEFSFGNEFALHRRNINGIYEAYSGEDLGHQPDSIRRTAAQWAGRCGARLCDVRNAGRWQTMKVTAPTLP